LVTDVSGTYFVGCATSANPADRPELYKIVIGPFPYGIVGYLDPVNELGAGHCAIGYDNAIQQILVNRSNGIAPFNGLNSFNWLSSSVLIPTNFFGAPNYDFDDLTSWAY
jgi:hypothetical protein